MFATALLAAAHLLFLLMAVAVAAAWLLLGLPEPLSPCLNLGAAAKLTAERLLPWRGRRAGNGGGGVSCSLQQRRHDPADAFKRLRYLSLRRCSLPNPIDAPADGGDGISSAGRISHAALLLLLWPAPALAAALGAAVPGAGGGAADGSGVARVQGAWSARSTRRQACGACGSALLRWLLPWACVAAQAAGYALCTLGLGRLPWFPAHLRWLCSCGSAGASDVSQGLLQRHARSGPQPTRRPGQRPLPPPPPLQSLLLACGELRFVDLTFLGGAAAALPAMSRLVRALGRCGRVHYLAVAQPGRLRLSTAPAVQHLWRVQGDVGGCGVDGAGAGTPVWGSDSEPDLDRVGDDGPLLPASASSAGMDKQGGLFGRWLLRWRRHTGSSGCSIGGKAPCPDVSRLGSSHAHHAATVAGPLLSDCAGLDGLIARELGL